MLTIAGGILLAAVILYLIAAIWLTALKAYEHRPPKPRQPRRPHE